jgi:hypothetical protein
VPGHLLRGHNLKSRGIARFGVAAAQKPEGTSLGAKKQTGRVELPKTLILLVSGAGFEPATPGL